MDAIERLTHLFEKFPGIGPRQARRFVQYLLTTSPSVRTELADTIRKLAAETSQCRRCWRWFITKGTTKDACAICSSTQRDSSMLFVVEKDADVENIERSGFRGKYFVLGGTIPLAIEEVEKFIRLRELIARLEAEGKAGALKEVILGLSATTEGDHTRQIVYEKIHQLGAQAGFTISSLGRGLSTGSELEYADPDTIQNALNSRN
jgi:recombination protein RecR